MEETQFLIKKYKAKRQGMIHFLLASLILFPIILFQVHTDLIQRTPWILLPFLAPIAFVLWFYLDTCYHIKGEILGYRSGFINGKIPVSEIREIRYGKTLWAGIKPALSTGGIIIRYGKYDEIYLAPERNSELIEDLIKINPKIIVSRFC
jgi:hypothetical protein